MIGTKQLLFLGISRHFQAFLGQWEILGLEHEEHRERAAERRRLEKEEKENEEEKEAAVISNLLING